MQRRIRDLAVLKDDLRARVDMVAYIGRTIELSQRGGNWFGLCPFHSETTPSFNVTPGKGTGVWSCLGCRESGDLFTFVQQTESCNFLDALKKIAEDVGFDLNAYYRELTAEEEEREGQFAFMSQVADVLHQQLLTFPQHVRFFTDRGINVETLEKFKIGFCPSYAFFEALIPDPQAQIVVEANEPTRRNIFDGKLLYPQFTPSGQLWGFFARNFEGIKPKYIGPSSQSTLFQGTSRLYGLAQVKPILNRSDLPCIIVEGFHDALAAQQANLPAIATCGTELSNDQKETLNAHAIRRAVVVFDGDEGGEKGMLRLALRDHQIAGLDLKFARIPGDPDEFILGHGADAFAVLIENASCAIETVINHHRSAYRDTPTGNLDFLNHIKPFITAYPRRSINRTIGIKSVAMLLQCAEEVIVDSIEETEVFQLSNSRAEAVILAEFCMNPDAFVLYNNVVPADFAIAKHRRLFELMERVYQTLAFISVDLLDTEAKNRGLDSSVIDLIATLPFIARTCPETLLGDMRDKALRRQTQDLADTAVRAIVDLKTPASETISEFVDSISDLLIGRKARQIFSSVEATDLVIRDLEAAAARDGSITGLDAGPDWSYLMRWVNGFQAGRLYLVAALSGVGKSMVLTNWASHLSLATNGPKASGLIVTMEMTQQEFIKRMISTISGVPFTLIDHGTYESESQVSLVTGALQRSRGAQIHYMEQQRTVRDIALQARILKAKNRLDYIMVDYVQLLDLSPYGERTPEYEKYGRASADLIALGQQLSVPIICAAQLNRTAYQEDTPSGEQIGGAYKIYQDAHMCYTLSRRPSGYLGFLDKNRGGASKKAVNLGFNSDESRSTLRINELSLV